MLPRLTPLASCLAGALAMASAIGQAASRTVTNCSDANVGSLRSAVAAAASSGDTVVFDMVQMACSTITLTSGQIVIGAEQITLQGPGAGLLTISGGNASRVFLDSPAGPLDYNRKLTINDLTIADGSAQYSVASGLVFGGCISSSGDVTLSGSVVKQCSVRNSDSTGEAVGGAVSATTLHLQYSTISGSYAEANAALGGGAYVRGAIDVRFSTISGNETKTSHTPESPGVGGGIASLGGTSGNVQIVSSAIVGNSADFGGGLYLGNNSGSRNIRVDHSTLSGNIAYVVGGGMRMYDSASNATATIVDSTISGNYSAFVTGGVANTGAALTISNSTVAFNHAHTATTPGGSVAVGLYTTLATLQSSIIAKNSAGAEADMSSPGGSTMLGSGNLIMVTVAGTTAPAGTLTDDPLLGALADNGGPTQTHALPFGGPAIGTGNNLARLPSDQRGPGFARSTAGKADIGAFQTGNGIFDAGFQ